MSRLFFSTSHAPPETRRDLVAAAFGAHVKGAIDFPSDDPIRTDLWLRRLGDVHVAMIDTTPVHFHTPPADDDAIYLGMTLSGGGVIDAAGAAHSVAPGDINLMAREQRCVTVVNQQSRILSVMVPRAHLAGRVRANEALRLVNPAAARLLQSYAGAILAEPGPLAHAEEAMLASHLADLAALTFGLDRPAPGAPGVRAARRAAIKADIERHLGDPDLSLDALARRHRLSASYIRALFYDEETSFSDFVAERRLDLAARLLAGPADAKRTIAAIAFTAGFSDISWFNRSFRRRYGVTPSGWRAGRR